MIDRYDSLVTASTVSTIFNSCHCCHTELHLSHVQQSVMAVNGQSPRENDLCLHKLMIMIIITVRICLPISLSCFSSFVRSEEANYLNSPAPV